MRGNGARSSLKVMPLWQTKEDKRIVPQNLVFKIIDMDCLQGVLKFYIHLR